MYVTPLADGSAAAAGLAAAAAATAAAASSPVAGAVHPSDFLVDAVISLWQHQRQSL